MSPTKKQSAPEKYEAKLKHQRESYKRRKQEKQVTSEIKTDLVI